jgi:3-oxoacyl-[acyl-carrier protein] reductase
LKSSGRSALVTGGSGAIGAAICRELAAAGHHVYVHAHTNLGVAQSLVAELLAAGASAEALCFDASDNAASRSAIDTLLARGPIQIIVHNAGVHDDAAFPGMTAQQWHRVIDVSLHGFYNVVQPLSLPMIRTRWGRIITITSVAGLIGNRGQVNYAAAKGALHAATRALALETATRGITVNAVAPGLIATSMTEGLFDAATIERLVPMKRAGRPEEVAGLVGYLASESAAYITGQILSVNGGMA